MTTDAILAEIRGQLKVHYEPREAEALARMVVEEVLHYSQVDVLLRGDFEQDDVLVERIRCIASRLCDGEPIQYILGHTTFHGLELKVTPATLIPRPETELLVDKIVDEAGDKSDLCVLDIGTGSGCIAIALARALKWAEVTAFDISAEALKVARENATTLKAKVDFEQCDILTATPPHEAFDIIVSNPPYVTESEKDGIERNVLEHEPATALFVPDSDPLKFYRAIAGYAAQALRPGGKIYFEINRHFGAETATLLSQIGYTSVAIENDQFGNPRYATATKD